MSVTTLSPADVLVAALVDALVMPVAKATWRWSNDPAGYVAFYVPKAPSWPHRFFQRVVLGIRWERV